LIIKFSLRIFKWSIINRLQDLEISPNVKIISI
jgi:hypothetical protein